MNKIRKKQWKFGIKKIFPKLRACRPGSFVPFNNGVLITSIEEDTVLYIEGRDIEILMSLIPWNTSLDPIRKMISESNQKIK